MTSGFLCVGKWLLLLQVLIVAVPALCQSNVSHDPYQSATNLTSLPSVTYASRHNAGQVECIATGMGEPENITMLVSDALAYSVVMDSPVRNGTEWTSRSVVTFNGSSAVSAIGDEFTVNCTVRTLTIPSNCSQSQVAADMANTTCTPRTELLNTDTVVKVIEPCRDLTASHMIQSHFSFPKGFTADPGVPVDIMSICSKGYRSERLNIVCSVHGKWTRFPSCTMIEVYCPDIAANLTMGNIGYSGHHVGAVARVTCPRGHVEMHHGSPMQCREDTAEEGKWMGSLGECTRMSATANSTTNTTAETPSHNTAASCGGSTACSVGAVLGAISGILLITIVAVTLLHGNNRLQSMVGAGKKNIQQRRSKPKIFDQSMSGLSTVTTTTMLPSTRRSLGSRDSLGVNTSKWTRPLSLPLSPPQEEPTSPSALLGHAADTAGKSAIAEDLYYGKGTGMQPRPHTISDTNSPQLYDPCYATGLQEVAEKGKDDGDKSANEKDPPPLPPPRTPENELEEPYPAGQDAESAARDSPRARMRTSSNPQLKKMKRSITQAISLKKVARTASFPSWKDIGDQVQTSSNLATRRKRDGSTSAPTSTTAAAMETPVEPEEPPLPAPNQTRGMGNIAMVATVAKRFARSRPRSVSRESDDGGFSTAAAASTPAPAAATSEAPAKRSSAWRGISVRFKWRSDSTASTIRPMKAATVEEEEDTDYRIASSKSSVQSTSTLGSRGERRKSSILRTMLGNDIYEPLGQCGDMVDHGDEEDIYEQSSDNRQPNKPRTRFAQLPSRCESPLPEDSIGDGSSRRRDTMLSVCSADRPALPRGSDADGSPRRKRLSSVGNSSKPPLPRSSIADVSPRRQRLSSVGNSSRPPLPKSNVVDASPRRKRLSSVGNSSKPPLPRSSIADVDPQRKRLSSVGNSSKPPLPRSSIADVDPRRRRLSSVGNSSKPPLPRSSIADVSPRRQSVSSSGKPPLPRSSIADVDPQRKRLSSVGKNGKPPLPRTSIADVCPRRDTVLTLTSEDGRSRTPSVAFANTDRSRASSGTVSSFGSGRDTDARSISPSTESNQMLGSGVVEIVTPGLKGVRSASLASQDSVFSGKGYEYVSTMDALDTDASEDEMPYASVTQMARLSGNSLASVPVTRMSSAASSLLSLRINENSNPIPESDMDDDDDDDDDESNYERPVIIMESQVSAVSAAIAAIEARAKTSKT